MHLGVLVYTVHYTCIQAYLYIHYICIQAYTLSVCLLVPILAYTHLRAYMHLDVCTLLGVYCTCIWAYAYTCIWACSIQAFGRIHMHLALYWSFLPLINISHLLLKFHTFIEFVSFIGVSYLLFEICIIYSSFIPFIRVSCHFHPSLIPLIQLS